jgi:hypothetical protein
MRKLPILILLNFSGLVPSAFAQARHANLSDQKMCAAQAKKAFLESDSSKEWKPSDKFRNVSPRTLRAILTLQQMFVTSWSA